MSKIRNWLMGGRNAGKAADWQQKQNGGWGHTPAAGGTGTGDGAPGGGADGSDPDGSDSDATGGVPAGGDAGGTKRPPLQGAGEGKPATPDWKRGVPGVDPNWPTKVPSPATGGGNGTEAGAGGGGADGSDSDGGGADATRRVPTGGVEAGAGGVEAGAGNGNGTAAGTEPEEKKMTNAEILADLFRWNKPRTDEERARHNHTWATIGDTLSSLANLYHTTQWAPNAYEPKNAMSEKTRERWDKIQKDRTESHNNFINFQLQRDKVEADKALAEAQLKANAEQRRWERDFKAGQQKFNEEMAGKANDREDAKIALEEQKVENARDVNEAAFEETARHNRAVEGISRGEAAYRRSGDYVTIELNDGQGGTVNIPKQAMNEANINQLSKILDPDGDGLVDEVKNGRPTGRKIRVSAETIMARVGQALQDPNVADGVKNALRTKMRNMAGQKKKEGAKPKGSPSKK